LRAIRHKKNDGRIDANGRLHSLARAPKFENFREIEEISRRLPPFFSPRSAPLSIPITSANYTARDCARSIEEFQRELARFLFPR